MRFLFTLLLFKLYLLALDTASPEIFSSQAATAGFPREQLSAGGIVKLYFDERPDIYINNIKQNIFAKKLTKGWLVLLPVSLYREPETLRIVSQTSKMLQVHLIPTRSAQYQKQYLRVTNKEFVRASKTTLKRIKRENSFKKEKLGLHTRLYIDDLKMIKPLDSTLRHDFGKRRFFNGIAKNPHAGIDLSGKVGDKIKAPLSGTVIVLGDLFYNGKMMLIDHGEGLITAYSHLSKIYKNDDDWVKQGEYIAEVGMSGRTTGPHLHWSVYLNGKVVNPELFLEFGKTPASEIRYQANADGNNSNRSN